MTDPAYLPKDPLGKLVRLGEECAEVQKEIDKILRFGLFSYHPGDPYKVRNRDRLIREIADLEYAIGAVNALLDEWPQCPTCHSPMDYVTSLLTGGLGGSLVCTADDCPGASFVIEVPHVQQPAKEVP
jgi:hypothetical protein